MGKVLLFLVAAVVGWFLVKGIRKPSAVYRAKSPGRLGEPERMLKCDMCGVHMPESESLVSDGKRTCKAPERCAHRQGA